MQEKQATAFLKALGVKSVNATSNWVMCSCPLAPFTHKSGKDSNPSFGVTLSSGESRYNCFTCAGGSLEDLVSTLDFHCQKNPELYKVYDLKAAREILYGENVEVFQLPEFEEFMESDHKPFEEWPEWFLSNFPSALSSDKAMSYLTSPKRRLSEALVLKYDLRYDQSRNMVLTPYRNVYGKLAGIRGRGLPDSMMEHYDYSFNKSNNAKQVWCGEETLNLEGDLIIVEGQFDRIRVAETYPKVIANLTAKPTEAKVRKLAGMDKVWLMLDNDKTGVEATSKFKKALQYYGVASEEIPYPITYKDPDSMSSDVMLEVLKSVGIV